MEYKEINESWENFKSSIQSSNYMQRLSLKRDEELFREGYMRGYEKREQKQVSRVEIINHTQPDKEIGRIFVYRGEIELSFQDGSKTLKVFI